jgi:hypothetical protein
VPIDWDRDPSVIKDKLANAYQSHRVGEADHVAAVPYSSTGITYNSTGVVLKIDPHRKLELKAKLFDTSNLLSITLK